MPEKPRIHVGLTDLLVDAGVVTAEQVQAGLVRQRETGLRIGETLVEIGAATEEDIGWALARQLGLPLIDLQDGTLDHELLDRFPAGVLHRLQAVPLLRSEEGLSVAMCDPTDLQVAAHLEALAGCPVLPSVTTRSAIRRVLSPRLGAHAGAAAARSSGPAQGGAVVWDRSGANFLHFHLHAARRAGAVAVHFVPDAGGVHVYQRGATGTVRVASESSEAFEALLTQLELLGAPVGALGDEAHRRVQVDCPLGTGSVRLDVALLSHDGATTVTLRVPDAGSAPRALDALGLDPVELARVREVLHRGAGLVVVSGPDGSGCSTTLASLLAEAMDENRSAIVFGDLVLPPGAPGLVLALPGAESRADWAAIVRAHDPDVVVLDDLVSGEDVAALSAGACAGRLVIARTDWIDTFALFEHVIERAHARSAFAGRVHLALQQRLLPSGAGGAEGLCAFFELLVVSEALRGSLRAGAPAGELQRLAQAEGFRALHDVLGDALAAGQLDAAVVSRAMVA